MEYLKDWHDRIVKGADERLDETNSAIVKMMDEIKEAAWNGKHKIQFTSPAAIARRNAKAIKQDGYRAELQHGFVATEFDEALDWLEDAGFEVIRQKGAGPVLVRW